MDKIIESKIKMGQNSVRIYAKNNSHYFHSTKHALEYEI